MAKHPTIKPWKPEDIDRLIALADSGATLLRACAALGRPARGVAKKARELGKPLPGVREVKASLRASGAISSDR